MATTTLSPTANSGAPSCYSTTAANARDGTGTLELQTAGDARIGQYWQTPNYLAYQHAWEFDLTGLTGLATITDAALTLYDWYSDAVTGFTLRAYLIDYGATLTTSDFASAAALTAATLLAHATAPSNDAHDVTFTNDALVASLVAGALNRMIVGSSRQQAGTTPSGAEYITSRYEAGLISGVAHPPTLTVTYTPGATVAGPAFQGGGFF